MLWGSGKRRREVKEIVKRMLMVLTVALVMVAMLAVTAAPAFAKLHEECCFTPGNGNQTQGHGQGLETMTCNDANCPPGQNK